MTKMYGEFTEKEVVEARIEQMFDETGQSIKYNDALEIFQSNDEDVKENNAKYLSYKGYLKESGEMMKLRFVIEEIDDLKSEKRNLYEHLQIKVDNKDFTESKKLIDSIIKIDGEIEKYLDSEVVENG